MNLYIFGAGASKASQDGLNDAKNIPPLVNELFDKQYYPYAKLIHLPKENLESYKHSMNSQPLEKWLTNWWEGIKDINEPLVKSAEKTDFGKLTFYIWWVLQNISNSYTTNNLYRKFLIKLKSRKESPKIITFNYDTLLDKALNEVFGAMFHGTLDTYTKQNYIKAHGSVNWFLEKRNGEIIIGPEMGSSRRVRFDIASSQMFNGSELSIENIHVIEPSHKDLMNFDFISHHRFHNDYFYPVILLPLTSKLYTFFTYFNERVISEGKKPISLANDIYMIGYSAQDEIITKEFLPNAPKGTKLHVIALKDANEIMDKVLEKNKNLIKGLTYYNGFSDFIEQF